MAVRLGILWLVLDEASSERLRQAAPPMYPNRYYHHVTLLYGVARAAVLEYIGRATTVEAYVVGHNTKAQAARVHTSGLPDKEGVPHVTLSTADGTPPYASVAMLKGEHQEAPMVPPLELSGTIEFEYLDQIKD